MEINKKKAKGIKIETEDYEVLIAIKKKDISSPILKEIWFKKK